MATVKVILNEDFPGLGYIGDIVSVKRGFSRNFIVPKGIGVEWGSSLGKRLEHIARGIAAKKAKKKGEAEELKKQLEAQPYNFELKVGTKGKSFGSISMNDIEMALSEKGFNIHRKQIRLTDSIKSGGTFSVKIKLHDEVNAVISVVVKASVRAEKDTEKNSERKGATSSKRNPEALASEEEVEAESPELVEVEE